MTRAVDVAAAVLIRTDERFLLTQRPAGKVYGGYWEFPGGKLEPNEAPAHALARELHEELGLDIEDPTPWITRVYAYPHATVRLHFFRVRRWRGAPHGREGQAFSWERAGAIGVAPMLPANEPVLRALTLPTEYAISNATEVGDEAFVAALERRLAGGLRLVQLREKAMPRDRLARLVARVVKLAAGTGAIVLVSGDAEVAHAAGAHGVHLTAAQLAATTARPPFGWVGASLHTAAELRRVEALGLDFAVLGAVHATPTHPGVPVLGWHGFERIARDAAVPVFAIGGLVHGDLERAWTHAAHGIAMIRGAWAEERNGDGGRAKGGG